MTRLLPGAILALTLAGCTGLAGTPSTASSRPAAADAAYCTESRGLDALLNNSINHYATAATLAAQGGALAAKFDASATSWRAGGNPGWKLLAAAGIDLRTWIAALGAKDGERANAAVLALWRDDRALPACSG